MNYKYAIFFDVDHTLYNPITKTIPASTQTALEKLSKRNDVLIGVATGRAFYMLDIIKTLKPYINAYITINGQVITYKNEKIHDDPMDSALLNHVKTVFKRLDLTYGFIASNTQVVNRMSEYVYTMFQEQKMPGPKIVDPDYDLTHPVYQVWAFGDDATLKEVSTHIDSNYIIPWISDGFDIIDPTKNKIHGIKKLINHLKIPIDHVYCFGDGENDKAMLQGIPNSFAMDNAHKTVKASANHTTEAYDQDGIYNALKRLDFIE